LAQDTGFERHYLSPKSRAERDAIMLCFLRALTFLSIAAALVAPVPSAAAGADVPPAAKARLAYHSNHGIQLATRKGTRSYQPGDAPSVAPAGTDAQGQAASSAGTKALDGCLALWDPDTHMTKDEWREACRRVMKERAHQPGT
jgi:hypothetical protein